MNSVPTNRVWIVVALLWPGISFGQSGKPSLPSIVPTGKPYTIVVEAATINTRSLAPGDSIGVYDGQTLVGKDAFQGSWPVVITAWQGDEGLNLTGFVPGNDISFKAKSTRYGITTIAAVDADFAQGDGTFGAGSYSVVTLSASSAFRPEIEVERPEAFGFVRVGQFQTQEVEISNVGTAPMLIETISSPETAFEVSVPSYQVPAQGAVRATVTFSPSQALPYRSQLVITTDDPITPSTTVQLSGQGLPSVEPVIGSSSSSLDFGYIELNTVRSKPLSVENRGSDTLKITQISVNSNVFSVNRSAFEIPPGRSETVQIQARPVSSGSRSGSVTITSNAVNAATYVIPTSLVGYNSAFGPVNETGLPYAVVFERALVDSTRLQAGEEIALFDGDNLVGKSVATGNWPLEVIAWQKTDAGQNGFVEGNPITVRTQASRYGATVTRNLDSLVVVRGDGTFGNGPFTVLKAYGKSGRAPLVRFNRTELGFPDTKVNRSSELTIVVENEGGTTLTGSLTVGQPYVITTSNNLSISPGGTAEVGLQFQPTVPGNYPASLSISTNDPFNPVSQISLNGRAIIDLGDDPVRFTGPATPVYPVPLDESQRITVNIYNPFNDPASGSLTVTSKGIVTPSITDGASVLLSSRTGRDIPIDLSPTGAGRDTLQLVYTSNAGEQAAYMLAIEVFEPIFGVPKSTGKPATLVVTSLTTVGRGFRPGDQVGVFDANTLVGLGVVTKTGENLPITMWEGDTGVGLPGFTRGNPIDLRIAKEARGYEGRQVLRPRTVSFSGGSTFGESAIQSVAVAVNEPPFFFSRLSDVGIDRNAFTSKIWARLDTLVVDVDGGSLTYEVETSNDGFQLSVVGTRLVATLEPDFSGKVDIYLTVREGPYVLSDTAVVRIANPFLAFLEDRSDRVSDQITLSAASATAAIGQITFSAENLPPGISIDAQTGELTGQLTTAGTYPVVIRAADQFGSANVAFSWTVRLNQPAVIATIETQRGRVTDEVQLGLTATDAENDLLTWSGTGLPPGLTLAANGEISGTLTQTGTFQVEVAVSDGYDTSDAAFEWQVSLNTPPVITSVEDQQHRVSDVISLPIQANDSDGDPLTFSASGLPVGLSIDANTGIVSGTITSRGSFNPTITVTDPYESVSLRFAWNITENNKPTVSAIENQSGRLTDVVFLQVVAQDADGDALVYSASGLPGGLEIDASTGAISGTLNAEGGFEVEVTISDGYDSVSTSFSWVVTDSEKPTVVPISEKTGRVTDSISLLVIAADGDGDALTYEALGLPTGLSINSRTGRISGQLASAGVYNVTVSVTDGYYSAITSFTWTVTVNAVPTISPIADQVNRVRDVVEITPDATDPDGDELVFRATGLPSGVLINPENGSISGTLSSASSSTVTVFVTDGYEEVETSFTWSVSVNNKPAISPVQNQAFRVSDRIELQIVTSDEESDILSYEATGLPTGLSIDAATGLISGVADEAGTYTSTVTVSDAYDATTIEFVWVITANRPPQVASIQNRVGRVQDQVDLQVFAVDADGDELAFAATGLPPDLSINAQTGQITGTLAAEGGYSIEIAVSDGYDETTITFGWAVSESSKPVIIPIATRTGRVTDQISLQVQAQDGDGDPLTFSATGLPDGLSIDEATGLITGTLTAVGTYSVIVVADDGYDSVEMAFQWVVTENRLPTVTALADRQNRVGDQIDFRIQASDADGDVLSYTADRLPESLEMTSLGRVYGKLTEADDLNVVIQVSDGYGSVEESFEWKITLNTPPSLETIADVQGRVTDTIFLAPLASDQDDDQLTYTALNLPTGLFINASTGEISGQLTEEGQFAVEYQVSDGYDITSQTFDFIVSLNDPPVIAPIENRAGRVQDEITIQVSATDSEGDALLFSAVNLPSGLSIDGSTGVISGTLEIEGGYEVTVRASDGYDTSSGKFSFLVTASNKPVVVPIENQSGRITDQVDLQIQAVDGDGDQLIYSASGLPPRLTLDSSTGKIEGTLTTAGTYSVIVVVSDGYDDVDVPFEWIVQQNVLPQVTQVADQTNRVGDDVSLAIFASDTEDDPLSFSATGLPAGLTINSTSGLISGRLTTEQGRMVTIEVDDGYGSASMSFNWFVSLSSSPVIVSIGDQLSRVGEAVILKVSASDVDNDPLQYSATGLPDGLSINATTGIISGIPTTTGPAVVVVSVSDGYVATTETFVWAIKQNSPPVVARVADQRSRVGDTVSLQLNATDAEQDELTFTSANLPVGLIVQPSTGLISGTLSVESVDDVVITVTDGFDSTELSFVWTTTKNIPPSIASIADQAARVSDEVSLQLSATDDDDDQLFFEAERLPTGLSIDPDGLITGRLEAAGVYTSRIAVTDGYDTTTKTMRWTVTTNKSPVLPITPALTGRVSDTISRSFGATDSDNDPLSYRATGLPVGLNIDGQSGLVSGELEQAGDYPVTVFVSDTYVEIQKSFTWNVTVNSLPTISAISDQTNYVTDDVVLDLVVDDLDDDDISFRASGLPDGLTINATTGRIAGVVTNAGTRRVTVTAADGYGESSAVFDWVVRVNQPPTIANVGDQQAVVGDDVSLNVTIQDPESDLLTVDVSGLPDGLIFNYDTFAFLGRFTSPGAYSVTIGVDDSYNSVTETFLWTVVGNSAPQIQVIPDRSDRITDAVDFTVVATDPNGDVLSYQASPLPAGISIDANSGRLVGDLVSSFDETVIVSVSDGRSTSTTSFDWVVRQNAPPTIAPITDLPDRISDLVDYQISASDADLDPLTYSAANLPEGILLDPNTGVLSGELVSAFNANVTISVADGYDITSITTPWIVELNTLPVVEPLEPQLLRTGEEAVIPVVAVDANNDKLSYVATGLPPTLEIDEELGLIEGTATTPGEFSSTIQVLDGYGETTIKIEWTVVDNAPPVIAAIPDQQSRLGEPIQLSVIATDANPGDVISFFAGGLPDGLTIDDSAGRISGTLAKTGSFTPTVSASDGLAETSVSFAWTVTENAPPLIEAIANQQNRVKDEVALPVVVTDEENDGLTTDVLDLPPGLAFDPSTSTISGTITDEGSYEVTITATDGFDTSTRTFNWNVTTNQLPIVTQLSPQSNRVTDEIDVTITVVDADEDPLAFSASGLPPGVTIDASTGHITGTLTAPSVTTVLIRISDGYDEVSTSFMWSVIQNAPPTIASIANRTDRVSDTIDLPLLISDNDGDDVIVTVENLPDGVTFNVDSRRIEGTLTQSQTSNVVIEASDAYDTTTLQFTWYITQNSKPNLDAVVSQATRINTPVDWILEIDDEEGDPLTTTVSGLPPGLTFTSSTGRVGGTPTSVGITNVRVEVSDGYDVVEKRIEWDVYDIIATTPQQVTNAVTVVEDNTQPVVEDFLMWSLPGNASSVTAQSLFKDAEFGIEWRLTYDNGATTDFLVDLPQGNLQTGRGYWLMTRVEPAIPASIATLTSNKPFFEITLSDSWNLIGNPWFSDVSWLSIIQANNLPNDAILFGYDRGFYASATLGVGLGYYFDNTNLGLQSLKIPYPHSDAMGKGLAHTGIPAPTEVTAILKALDESGHERQRLMLGTTDTAEEGIDSDDIRLPRLDELPGGLYSIVANEPLIRDVRELGANNVFKVLLKARKSPRAIEIVAGGEEVRIWDGASGAPITLGPRERHLLTARESWQGYIATGDVSMSELLGVGSELHMEVYPNPTVGPISIELFSDKDPIVHVALYDVIGRLVFDLPQNGSASDGFLYINSDISLPPGMYFVRANTETKSITRSITVTR